jgi:hypothetical protein
MLLARLERVPARLPWRAWLRGVCEAAVCVCTLGTRRAARIRSRGLSGRWLIVDAVLVVFVVVAPIVAVVCILLRSHPLLRLCTVYIRLEGHRLAGREGRGRAVTAACQLRNGCALEGALQWRLGRLAVEAVGPRHGVVGLRGPVAGVCTLDLGAGLEG